MEEKTCHRCGETKPLSYFGRYSADGINGICKKCSRRKQMELEKANRTRITREGIDEAAPKTCARCKETKTRGDFFIDRAKKHGVCSNCKVCATKTAMEKYERDKVKLNLARMDAATKDRYGITTEEKRALAAYQENVCAVCGSADTQNQKYGDWFVDHNHETGEIRGLLCALCNFALGNVRDSKAILLAMISYLEVSPATKFFGSPRFVPNSYKERSKKWKKYKKLYQPPHPEP